jgi:hypothetical protein
VQAHSSPANLEAVGLKRNESMIAFFDLDLNRIAHSSHDYPWPSPGACARCGHPKVWGHGLVPTIIEGFDAALKIRRYRCPMCGCIIRLRPRGYFVRHQTEAKTIRRTLWHRLVIGRWPRGCIANRGRHWLCALKRNTLAVLGVTGLCDLMAAFDRLVELGRVPVARTV